VKVSDLCLLLSSSQPENCTVNGWMFWDLTPWRVKTQDQQTVLNFFTGGPLGRKGHPGRLLYLTDFMTVVAFLLTVKGYETSGDFTL